MHFLDDSIVEVAADVEVIFEMLSETLRSQIKHAHKSQGTSQGPI